MTDVIGSGTRKGAWRTRRAALALLVAVAFVAQGLLPGLDLAIRGGAASDLLGIPSAICHAPLSGEASAESLPVGAGQAEDHLCCLVCQAAGVAQDLPPSPTFANPTSGTAGRLLAIPDQPRIPGRAYLIALARAPPAPAV